MAKSWRYVHPCLRMTVGLYEAIREGEEHAQGAPSGLFWLWSARSGRRQNKPRKVSFFALDSLSDWKVYAVSVGEKQPTLKIGELAKRFGLNVRTLRYYETLGLLPAARLESGYRVYSEGDAKRLGFIVQASELALA